MLRLINVSLLIIFLLIISGCDSFPGNIQGDVNPNQPPIVEFANVPAEGDTFSYAPVIYWKGRDSDGFVEHYLYADIIDSSALIDPVYYIDFIPEEAWVMDTTTSDTVYLRTETGVITEHVFYLKCVDDLGTESQVIYRTFYRSNDPPRVPDIKWWINSDASEEFTDANGNGRWDPGEHFDDENENRRWDQGYDQFFYYYPSDTLYCLDEITDTWPGLGFIWKSSDPNDRDLYTIPLEYRYYLEKVPHDTIWQWEARDWSNTQELQFFGLETGHYIFTVWARDDGFEKSIRPATATFDVYKPSFEQDLLLFNVTTEDPGKPHGQGYIVPGTQVGELYNNLCLRSGYTPDYIHYSPNEIDTQPWKSFLGRYRLIIYFSENRNGSGADLDSALFDYIKIGGRLWVIGSFMQSNSVVGDSILNLANSAFADPPAQSITTRHPEFKGTASGVDDLPELCVDTTKIADIYSVFLRNWDYLYLPGIDIMATGDEAEAVYYFRSYTDELDGVEVNDIAEVKVFAGTIYYPPTPVDCIIKMPRNRILEISRVENISRGVVGEVQSWTNNAWQSGSEILAIAKISYPFGEPWSVDDTILVDYRYQPTSQRHLRPCAIRYEKLSGSSSGVGLEIRYRIAVFTFPLYFLDNDNSTGNRVDLMFNNMLNWFYQPYAH